METRADILKELREIAPKLASVNKHNGYTVPIDYFIGFNQNILDKIKFGEVGAELNKVAPALANVKKSVNAQMPAAYFNSFSESLLKNIRHSEVSSELTSIAPTLSKLQKVKVFEVPANYFSALPTQLLSKVNNAEQAPTTSAPQWMNSLNAILDSFVAGGGRPKYAVAFAGIATTVIIGLMILVKFEQSDDIDRQLASISNEEINSYLDKRPDMYTDEIFESAIDEKMVPAIDNNEGVHIYRDALKDVDDASLDEAILN